MKHNGDIIKYKAHNLIPDYYWLPTTEVLFKKVLEQGFTGHLYNPGHTAQQLTTDQKNKGLFLNNDNLQHSTANHK